MTENARSPLEVDQADVADATVTAHSTPQTPTSAKSSRVERTRTYGRDGRAPGLATTGAPKPYYTDELVTLYHGDCMELIPDMTVVPSAAAFGVLLTDPPYGIAYKSGSRRSELADSIVGDLDTELRDYVVSVWDGPMLIFGTWRIPRPAGTRARLIWDTKGALGMGDLSIPWKPSDQEIYVLGSGFKGHRDNNVIQCAPVQSMARNGRHHPHEKPVDLLMRLLDKCPPGPVFDPFAGSGSTLVAAKRMGRKALGIEIEERYCEIAARRLAQGCLDFGEAS